MTGKLTPSTREGRDSLDLLGDPFERFWQAGDSDCRFVLGRAWDWTGPIACVIGCNPSTADGTRDDSTSKWWGRWFRHWGYGGYYAVNLYPFRTPDPAACRRIVRGVTEADDWWARDQLMHNTSVIQKYSKEASAVFACWGNIAWDADWIDHVVEMVQTNEAPWPDILCWGTTKSGAPVHPMARGKHRIDPLTPSQMWKACTR